MNIQVIPAIDIMDGKCVRLTKGDYGQRKTYDQDPLALAQQFEELGFQRLHLVDLDGAKQKKVINWKTLETICSQTNLIVDFGGGIQSDDDLAKVFDAGAELVTCGSIAIKQPEMFDKWLEEQGAERIILAADVRDKMVSISGWQEQTALSVFDFLKGYQEKKGKYVLCTDISKDGMLQGTATELYDEIQQQFPDLNIIASGGVSGWEDIDALEQISTFGVVVGKAIFEGKIDLSEWKNR